MRRRLLCVLTAALFTVGCGTRHSTLSDDDADIEVDGDTTCSSELEICNGLDDNCDGIVPAFEADEDGDGILACEGDCDDHDPDVSEFTDPTFIVEPTRVLDGIPVWAGPVPSLQWTGSEFVLLWNQMGAGFFSQRISSEGELLGTQATVRERIAGSYGLSWSGNVFLMCWYAGTLDYQLIDGSGNALSETLSLPGTGDGTPESSVSSSPQVLWNGHEFLVVWFERLGGRTALSRAFLSESGDVLSDVERVMYTPDRYPTVAEVSNLARHDDVVVVSWQTVWDGGSSSDRGPWALAGLFDAYGDSAHREPFPFADLTEHFNRGHMMTPRITTNGEVMFSYWNFVQFREESSLSEVLQVRFDLVDSEVSEPRTVIYEGVSHHITQNGPISVIVCSDGSVFPHLSPRLHFNLQLVDDSGDFVGEPLHHETEGELRELTSAWAGGSLGISWVERNDETRNLNFARVTLCQ